MINSSGPSTLDTIGVPTAKKASDSPPPPSAEETRSAYAQQLAEVPELADYGPVINSTSSLAQLTETETEYQVTCVKHIFKEHIVFQARSYLWGIAFLTHPFVQYNVSNTLPDTVLEQVSIIMQPQSEDSGLTEDFIIPVPSLSSASSPSIVYVSFTRDNPEEYAVASFGCIMKFVSKEVDPSTGEPEDDGYEDEYQLEDVELSAGGDYIIPSYATFGAEWDRLRSGASATETFALSAMESLKGETVSQYSGDHLLTHSIQRPATQLSKS